MLHHLLQTLPGRGYVAFNAFQEDGDELIFLPMADEIRGAQAVLQRLADHAQRGVHRGLAVAFAKLSEIINRERQNAEGHGMLGVEGELFAQMGLRPPVIQQAG